MTRFFLEHLWFLSACLVECYHIIYTCRYAMTSFVVANFQPQYGNMSSLNCVCNFMYIGERIRSQLNACKNELVVKLRKEANIKISIQDIYMQQKVLYYYHPKFLHLKFKHDLKYYNYCLRIVLKHCKIVLIKAKFDFF